MRKHADILRPKFEKVWEVLDRELGGLEIGTWTKPLGGYFISFDSMEGCAKAIVAKAKEAGLVLTGAGATYPYGKDPKEMCIRDRYYVDTVGKNTAAIKAYIQNQLKEDLEYDQMSLVEYIDPFTGEPVKKNKK